MDFIVHPVKTIESTIDAIAHPIESYDYISKSIVDSFKRDVVNGDANSRAEWFAYALGTIGLSAAGTKGLGALSKTGMATTKVVSKAGASKVKGAADKFSALNLLPYAPRNQLAYANVGVVPYNVLNGAGMTDQLVSMAKVETKGSGKGKGNPGRSGKQSRLKEIANEDKVSTSLRGEIKRDINEIKLGKRKSIRVPQWYNLAHRRGYEARKGYGYEYSDLQTIRSHRTQHKHDGYGKRKK